MPLELDSPAFQRSGPLDPRFSAAGGNLDPPLAWTGAPRRTRPFGLIAEDPDAPLRPFVHWLTWGIAGHLGSLPEGIAPHARVARQGRNDWGALGRGGPKPPAGFRLYALDGTLGPACEVARADLEAGVLDDAALTAKFWRSA